MNNLPTVVTGSPLSRLKPTVGGLEIQCAAEWVGHHAALLQLDIA